MNEKVIVKFKPAFLLRLSKADSFLNEMQKKGWELTNLKFGCLLYFRECKVVVEKYYYITQFAVLHRKKYDVGVEALLNLFKDSYIDHRVFSKTKLVGLRSLNFTVYCFSKEDHEKILIAANLRKKDLHTSIFLYINYFFTNFICLPVALYFIISKMFQK